LTVSVFRETYPEKLVQMLEEDGAIVEMTAPGVYEVKSSNFFFPAQIVVTKDLDVKKHASLRILSRNAKIEDVEQFLKESEKADTPWERENISSILEVSISANRQTFEKFKRRDSTMCDALRDLMKDEIEEELEKERAEGLEKGLEKGREEAQKKNAFKFYQQGNSPEFIADFLEFPVEQVKKWLGLEKA
jgi:predicted transposase YdaD